MSRLKNIIGFDSYGLYSLTTFSFRIRNGYVVSTRCKVITLVTRTSIRPDVNQIFRLEYYLTVRQVTSSRRLGNQFDFRTLCFRNREAFDNLTSIVRRIRDDYGISTRSQIEATGIIRGRCTYIRNPSINI